MSLKDSLEIIARDIDVLDQRVDRLERVEQVFTIYAGEVVINEASVDVDLRIEGDGDTNLVIIDAGGDAVGIGTVPTYKLDVLGSIRSYDDGANAQQYVESYGNSAFILIRKTNGTFAVPTALANGDRIGGTNFQGYDGGAWGTGVRIEGFATENWGGAAHGTRLDIFTVANGAVATTRQMRIQEDGGIYMYNLLGAAATTDINLDGANELHRVVSSRRYKKSIKPLDKRFDSSLIYELEPVSFEWRKNTANPDMVDFGLIAEDVYDVFPSLVNLDNEDRPDSIRYTMLPVLLLAEIQKLNDRIKELENGN